MWRLKMAMQWVLARIPLAERTNYIVSRLINPRLHTAEEIAAQIPAYAMTLRDIRKTRPLADSRVVEIGTGWCPIAPLLASFSGVASVLTIDHYPHLTLSVTRELLLACKLTSVRLAELLSVNEDDLVSQISALLAESTLSGVLRSARIEYAPTLAALDGIPPNSVDLWYSYSVMENIPLDPLKRLMRTMSRTLAKDGVIFAAVGCQDPFTGNHASLGAIQYLRYSARQWERLAQHRLCTNNRMRCSDFVSLFKESRLSPLVTRSRRALADVSPNWSKVNEAFRAYDWEDLSINYFEVMCTAEGAAQRVERVKHDGQ